MNDKITYEELDLSVFLFDDPDIISNSDPDGLPPIPVA